MLDTTNDRIEHSPWMSHSLIEATIKTFSQNSKSPLEESEAVELLLAMSQLLEATGMSKLEVNDEEDNEEVHGVGEGQQS